MVRVIFLGTAGNTAVLSKQQRACGGIILQCGELQFHLDPGPGALLKAWEYGINPRDTTAAIVSHNHVNHCSDINAVIDAMTLGGLDRRGLLLASKSLINSEDNQNTILTKYHQNLLEKVIPLEKNHKVGIEFAEIHALPAQHTDPTALGFKILFPNFCIGYTGDTVLTPGLIDGLKGCDILILNVPYPSKRVVGLNLNTDSAIELISAVRPKLAIMTHFTLEMLKADPLNEAREAQRLSGVQTIAAKDGLIIAPEGYGQNRSPVKGYQ